MYPGPLPPGQTTPIQIKDWSHWKHIKEFTVLEAACLWVEIEPLINVQALQCAPQAAGRCRTLIEAIEAGVLGKSPRRWFKVPEIAGLGLGGKPVPHQGRLLSKMRLSRGELMSYATSIGERPLFLFPPLPVSHEDAADKDRGAFQASTTSPKLQTHSKKRQNDADLEKRIRTVLKNAELVSKQGSVKALATTLIGQKRNEGFSLSALEKILNRRYGPMIRLGI